MIRWNTPAYRNIGGREFELVEPLTFRLNEVERITVPAGFVCDLASIPRVFWAILPRDGDYWRAAIIHDYLYAGEFIPRKKADDIFLHALCLLELPMIQAYAMYAAVRAFGGWHHTARSVAQTRLLAGYFTGDYTCVDPKNITRPLCGWDDKVII